jgi:mRNA-degrading endonuclease RelE of RelBE toxin-antitoxin system
MPYRVTITREAKSHLLNLSAREQRIVGDGVAARLLRQPTTPSLAVKPLRPNPLAGYELRLGDLCVLYRVDDENAEVVVVAVGRKVKNVLLVEGKEFHGHQDHLAE